jgi:hypothetical protein
MCEFIFCLYAVPNYEGKFPRLQCFAGDDNEMSAKTVWIIVEKNKQKIIQRKVGHCLIGLIWSLDL